MLALSVCQNGIYHLPSKTISQGWGSREIKEKETFKKYCLNVPKCLGQCLQIYIYNKKKPI
jgi:hypothetical protein